MAIFMQVISARLGVVTGKDLAQCCRDWYPALDPLAQLADERSGHRRLRPGRSSRQRRRPQPALPHPAALGRHHHRPRRAAAAGPATIRHAHHRSRRPAADRDHRASATSSRFSCSRRPSPAFWRWDAPCISPPSPSRNGLRRHRHHRRDRHAAQPLPALGARAEPPVAER